MQNDYMRCIVMIQSECSIHIRRTDEYLKMMQTLTMMTAPTTKEKILKNQIIGKANIQAVTIPRHGKLQNFVAKVYLAVGLWKEKNRSNQQILLSPITQMIIKIPQTGNQLLI